MMKKQRGVTMIELLVAMVLGLGLVAGIGQLFVQSQKSFRLQRNLSDMTDDAAFLMEAFAKGLLQAGYSEDGKKQFLSSTNEVFTYSDVPNISFNDNDEYIRGSDDNIKGSQIVYRYKLSNLNELDNSVCTSFTAFKNAATVGQTITVRMYKKEDVGMGTFVFYCKPAIDNSSQDAQPLVSDVEKLIFEYGIHDESTGMFYYTNATSVTNWKNVFAVKVFLVMRSAEDNVVKNKMKFKIESTEYTATDNRLYKVFTKTIFLRAPIQ